MTLLNFVPRKQFTDLIKFEEDTSNAPNITGLGPSKLEDDLGRSVVSGGDNTGVVFPIKRGRSKVYQLDTCVSHSSDVSLVCWTVLAVPIVAYKQNVLRLQICMGQVVIVKKLKIKRLIFDSNSF